MTTGDNNTPQALVGGSQSCMDEKGSPSQHDAALRPAAKGLPPRRGGRQRTPGDWALERMLTCLEMFLNNTVGSLDQ